MKKIISSVVAVAAIFVSTGAFAHQAEVRCASAHYKTNECGAPMRFVEDVTLLRQISHAPCIAGETYGIARHRHGMWVTNGCEGTFLIRGR